LLKRLETKTFKGKGMIQVENADKTILESMGVFEWPVWSKEVSEFPWQYDCAEICYLVEGEAIISPDQGEPVTITSGQLVQFEKGLSCTWKIIKPVRKHYQFE